MSSVEPNVLLELASGFWKGKNLQSWSRTRDNAIFWCQGRPGIGKTMLALVKSSHPKRIFC